MFVTAKKSAKSRKNKNKQTKKTFRDNLIKIKNVNGTRQSPQGTAKRPLIIPFRPT